MNLLAHLFGRNKAEPDHARREGEKDVLEQAQEMRDDAQEALGRARRVNGLKPAIIELRRLGQPGQRGQ